VEGSCGRELSLALRREGGQVDEAQGSDEKRLEGERLDGSHRHQGDGDQRAHEVAEADVDPLPTVGGGHEDHPVHEEGDTRDREEAPGPAGGEQSAQVAPPSQKDDRGDGGRE
jgi:hypothetical protein